MDARKQFAIFVAAALLFNAALSLTSQEAEQRRLQALQHLDSLKARYAQSKRNYDAALLDYNRKQEVVRTTKKPSSFGSITAGSLTASYNLQIAKSKYEHYRYDWFPKRDEINRAIEEVKRLDKAKAVALAREQAEHQQHEFQQRIREQQKLLDEQSRQAADPKHYAKTILRYGTIVQIRCRGVKSNAIATWPIAWTLNGGPYWSNLDGLLEVLLTEPGRDQRSSLGAHMVMLRKAEDPTNIDAVRYGEQIEIWSMHAAENNGLGVGRKWWVNEAGNPWYWDYPHIVVGPNDDEWGMKDGQPPRPESGREQFVLESASGKIKGEAVFTNDVLRIKTSTSNPALPDKYVWTNPGHKKWGNNVWQLLIAGPGGEDLQGIKVVGKDRSMTVRNQFFFQEAPIATGYESALYQAQSFTPAFLPQGTVISLKHNGSYVRAIDQSLRTDGKNPNEPNAQFEIRYEKNGWIGLKNMATKTYLQGSRPPIMGAQPVSEYLNVDELFKPNPFFHWYFDGTFQKLLIRNKASHRNLAVDATGSFSMDTQRLDANFFSIEIISRPVNQQSPEIKLSSAQYGFGYAWKDVTRKLQEILNKEQGKQIFLPGSLFSQTFGDPQPGAAKTLTVNYTLLGRPQVLTLTEKDTLNLVSIPQSSAAQIRKKRIALTSKIAELEGKPLMLQAPNKKFLEKTDKKTVLAVGSEAFAPNALFSLKKHGDSFGIHPVSDTKLFLTATTDMATMLTDKALESTPAAQWQVEVENGKIWFQNVGMNGYLSLVNNSLVVGQPGKPSEKGASSEFRYTQLTAFQMTLRKALSLPNFKQTLGVLYPLVNTTTQFKQQSQLINAVGKASDNAAAGITPEYSNLLYALKYNVNFQTKDGKPYAGFTQRIDKIITKLKQKKAESDVEAKIGEFRINDLEELSE